MPEEPLSDEERITLTIDAMLAKSAFDPERLLPAARRARWRLPPRGTWRSRTTPSGADADQGRAVRADEPAHRYADSDEQRRHDEKRRCFTATFDLVERDHAHLFPRAERARRGARTSRRSTGRSCRASRSRFNDMAILMSPALAALLEVALETDADGNARERADEPAVLPGATSPAARAA
jgi:hypothetical protein